MLERRYSAAEVARHAGLTTATLTYFLREGVLDASLQRAEGRGRGNVFDCHDVLAAMSLNSLRLPNAAAAPFKKLVDFWHSSKGKELTRSLVQELEERTAKPAGVREPSKPRVLFVTAKGVELDRNPSDLMEQYDIPTVFCVDARYFVEYLLRVGAVEATTLGFEEPGPNGRVPTHVPQKPRRRQVGARDERPRKRRS